MHKQLPALALMLALTGCATSDWEQGVGQVLGAIQQPAGQSSALGEGEIIGGLREALAQGTTKAINQLGRRDGYWNNAQVRIPLPASMARFESGLRQIGQGKVVDEFHLTLNRAAEQAVPQVADIFGNAVRQMSIQDARAILSGSPDAATQFFRRTTSESIYAKVYPIVQTTTQRVGVTQQYKQLATSYGPLLKMAGVKNLDLDSYVTEQALTGLFTTIAEEEARIRQNPAARTSELLKRVFGSQGR
ncbi:DUF4197 domain-containing protein [Solimonas sp. K1W22B-7]|uniref:DUF4197 domain-containing protein n=1 Tax=Solimonas sp. K1W22B-7 TaxID=2303331 RepID=UPI000E332A18|nr:DUF4197 domain-containing protein [Solimonas sp. K1W22B-7]AXQ28174.1 DUF4197 domain-containing protein [Solimonas sp. K1W22B-7]